MTDAHRPPGDAELIERLRRTLQTEAAAVTPNRADHPTASYTSAAVAPVHPLRRRWPLAVMVAAAAAAAVTLAVLNWPGGGGSRIGVVGPGPSSPPAPTNSVPTVAPSSSIPPATTTVSSPGPVPATIPPTPTTDGASLRPVAGVATTVPPGGASLPASFQPEAVTFVSALDGWVAGRVPCGSEGWCLAMGRTTDGGQTWMAAPAPPATGPRVVAGPSAVSLRFADHMDGWIYAVNPTRVWSTHDGGIVWRPVQPPGLSPTATISAMEVSGGSVWVAVISPNAITVQLERSPVGTDAWTDVDTGVPVGAGPVPAAQLALHGTSGWLVENDRAVVGGTRLDSAAQWLQWTSPPCARANGTAALAASSTSAVVAICAEGTWGPPGNLPAGATFPSTWVFTSSDGGNSFQPVGPLPAGVSPASVASPAPSTIVGASLQPNGTGTSGALWASFNGGRTWQTVLGAPSVVGWSDLGFTTLTQGVVIGMTQSGSTLYMTRNGGQTWSPVIP